MPLASAVEAARLFPGTLQLLSLLLQLLRHLLVLLLLLPLLQTHHHQHEPYC
jgi:hypothetical protein